METQFITIQLPLQASPNELRHAIEAALSKQGKPLRWAITALDKATATATVEAIITTEPFTTDSTTTDSTTIGSSNTIDSSAPMT